MTGSAGWQRFRGGATAVSSAEWLILAALAYIPPLIARPGVVTSDTKTYLYLNPGKFLRQVATMWDPTVGLGTVTHQYIGYLLPMGPFYWFFSWVGAPTWVAQRLWLGSILFAAGTGILYLCKTLNVSAPGRSLGALAFMLSPYFLQYAGRISLLLLPWAGLPWLVALTAKGITHKGWRYPAIFAIVAAVTSGDNATAILYVGIAPALWLLFSVVVHKQSSWLNALQVAAKIVILTGLCCLWWIEGLIVEAGYGVDVLRYTETLAATSYDSSPIEVIRGLGYWYFYGSDRQSSWTAAAILYTQRLWLLGLSYAIPAFSVLVSIVTRWTYRAYFAVLVLVGLVLSVAANPLGNPTPWGSLMKRFMQDTTAGFALRSTDRATPLLLLGLAILLAAGVAAFHRCFSWSGFLVAIVGAAAVIANNPSLFNGQAEVASFFTQPAKLPPYEMAAIKYLNGTHPQTRVLAIPGEQFSAFQWGDTVDPPQPAFLNRPFVTREQQVMGSIATADTLGAIDDPIQRGTAQWQALAPMARLLSAGDVLVQYDQEYEHYNSPNPVLLAQQIATTPSGLSNPVSFGKPRGHPTTYRDITGVDLSNVDAAPDPPPLVDYTVSKPRPITRAESDSGAMIISGEATGLENLAAAGLLNTTSAIYYSGAFSQQPKLLKTLLRNGASLVITDTNRKEAFRWDNFADNFGFTETPSDNPAKNDPSDSPIVLFKNAPTDSKTFSSYTGAANVTASSYGLSDAYTPEYDAYAAIDENLDTSWITGDRMANPAGQWWQVQTSKPITASHITLVQPQSGNTSRSIASVKLTFDGSRPVEAKLIASSRTPSGQTINFARRSFRKLRITIEGVTGPHTILPAATPVGLAEVQIPGLTVSQVIQMPTDLTKAVGAASIKNRLTIDMSRERVSPYSFPYETDPETSISREFTLPTSRAFSLSGTTSISSLIPDDEINDLVGQSTNGASSVVAYSKGRLPGDLQATASAAADNNLSTAWQPGFGANFLKGQWLEYDLAKSITFNHLDLQVIADGRHSVPTALTVSTQDGTRSIRLPPIADGTTPGHVVSVPVNFAPLSGSHIRITVTGIRLESSPNYYSRSPIALPLGVAEVGIPGFSVNPVPASLPSVCRSNLIKIDGKPISVQVVGSAAAALDGGEMTITPCGADAKGITLAAGPHVVSTALGHSPSTGWNIDQITLDSAPGGAPAPSAPFGSLAAAQPGQAPAISIHHKTSTSEQVDVSGASSPFELVLGESINRGWTAVASPGPGSGSTHIVNLGAPQLVDGFANGWQVSQKDLSQLGASRTGRFTVAVVWIPQEHVWGALIISAASILACLTVAICSLLGLSWRRKRRPRAAGRASMRPNACHFDIPRLGSPLSSGTRRPPVWVIALVTLASTGVACGVGPSIPLGLAIGFAVLASLSIGWLRGPLCLSAAGLLIAAAVIVVHAKAAGTSPFFANTLVWGSVIALVADAIVQRARRPKTGETPAQPVKGT
ncbi:MAG: alpha-(1-_3)-arabinofuranosyltransferase domain-containing protein [Acidimicrobiales bacterium]